MGIVETQYYTFAAPPGRFLLDSGEKLVPITVAYETYGDLNEDRSNAILVLHALSGDAHAAGLHKGQNKPGWWDDMIGPGRAFDTDKYFVVCSNVLGGCKGTTGPSSINPSTGRPFGTDFPLVTIPDMVRLQGQLLDHLGIDRLLSVAGGSMGGQQVLEWLVSYPYRVQSAIVIATAARHSPQQIAFNEVGRQAIMADPDWQNGRYYGGESPAKGLSVARMVGHITYMSDISMAEKFGRRTGGNGKAHPFSNGFEVEDYLHYRGLSFVDRFDANSYLYITRAIDEYDATRGGNLADAFKGLKAKILVLSFKSDWLYPSYQSLEIVRACKTAGVDVTYCEINSTYGHDAFLLEVDEETTLVSHFLIKVFEGAR
ncbi:MAG: homoserine O-acetyltransferase [Actinobacteria bacterium]|nr:homoserine O-acetyltransferase [Actinomycetota bacterium]MBU4490547.1 homoserine O-acetyltransferase [Actinomycetota bacterium]